MIINTITQIWVKKTNATRDQTDFVGESEANRKIKRKEEKNNKNNTK